MNNQNNSMLTHKEAAAFLKVGINTLKRWRDQNLVKAVKIATWNTKPNSKMKCTYRYKESDLMNIGTDTQAMMHERKRKGA